jgi:glucosamine--fructose-6-phosphate aminotransferase (isomerizing)
MFVLGKGACIAAAQEGALKLKEVAYLHAEGLSSSALKHGPLALITDGVPVVLLDVGTAHRDKNDTCAHEVLARGARLVRVTDRADTEPSDLSIPANRVFGALIANVELQLLSYFAALARGHNPDFPRNLAKCVTVD